MRALMTVATVAAFVFVATGQADAQKRTGRNSRGNPNDSGDSRAEPQWPHYE
jgi:hypothetical protein